jgi:hypothetical protein
VRERDGNAESECQLEPDIGTSIPRISRQRHFVEPVFAVQLQGRLEDSVGDNRYALGADAPGECYGCFHEEIAESKTPRRGGHSHLRDLALMGRMSDDGTGALYLVPMKHEEDFASGFNDLSPWVAQHLPIGGFYRKVRLDPLSIQPFECRLELVPERNNFSP